MVLQKQIAQFAQVISFVMREVLKILRLQLLFAPQVIIVQKKVLKFNALQVRCALLTKIGQSIYLVRQANTNLISFHCCVSHVHKVNTALPLLQQMD